MVHIYIPTTPGFRPRHFGGGEASTVQDIVLGAAWTKHTITGGSLAPSSNVDVDLRFFAKCHSHHSPLNRFVSLVVAGPQRHGHNKHGIDIGTSAYYALLARNLINSITKFAIPKSGPSCAYQEEESYWTLQHVPSLLADNVDV